MTSLSRRMGELHEYAAPEWAASLDQVPSHRLKLANVNTPIHEWKLSDVPQEFQLFIKRDDMTGSTLSGNKVRKLDFLLAEALQQGCRHVVTYGGLQSNHCRTTAVACAQLGLIPHLLLRTPDHASSDCSGNMLLNRLSGARIYSVPAKSQEDEIKARVAQLTDHLQNTMNEKVYFVPLGGSNALGTWGYMEAFQELLNQGVSGQFDDLVMACGSGGTLAGISIANYLSNTKLRVHGVIVSDQPQYFTIKRILPDIGLKEVKVEDILNLIDGFKGVGHEISTPEEKELLARVAAQSGVMLDHTYTVKAVRALLILMKEKPDTFKGRRVLFLHTGGIFGNFDGRLDETLLSSALHTVQQWPHINMLPEPL